MPTAPGTPCLFCGVALGPETWPRRASAFTLSGVVVKRYRWCQACDDGTAAARAAAHDRAARREDRRAYMRAYNARPEVRRAKREHAQRQAWRRGATSFRCAHCGRRWKRAREARSLIDGRWHRHGVCGDCRPVVIGPSKHETKAPAMGWAAYLRARRARQRDKGTGSGNSRAA